jgi:hypothetical protein
MYSLDVDIMSFLFPETHSIEERFGGLEPYVISTLDFRRVDGPYKLICGLESSTCKNIPCSFDNLVGKRLFEVADGTLRVTRHFAGTGKVSPVLEERGKESLLLVGEFTFLPLLGEEVHGF